MGALPAAANLRAVVALLALFVFTGAAHGAADAAFGSDVWRVLTLRDYNTRLIVLSTGALGLAAGLVGTFLLLRQRALMGDALSHATLPGIALAFIVMVAMGEPGKSLPGLLLGAAVLGLAGVACVLGITRLTRLDDDAALGIVLSVFFGIGIALLGIAQQMPGGSAAGLSSFIYGKTASMVYSDLLVISVTAIIVAAACALLHKEFTLLCFDDAFAAAQGWPTLALDVILLALVTLVTVVGLQAVGLILIIALLIIPPAAARFWADRTRPTLAIAAGLGAASGCVGAAISAVRSGLPAGAIIVLVAAAFFVISMIAGTKRGAAVRFARQWRLNRRIADQHLLRALYEAAEDADAGAASFATLLTMRSWSARGLRRLLRRAQRRGLVQRAAAGADAYGLTDAGRCEAGRIVRNHRLWEMYLIAHAEVAPSHVDRGADHIEHVLGPAQVARLEALLGHQPPGAMIPPSPHELRTPSAGDDGAPEAAP